MAKWHLWAYRRQESNLSWIVRTNQNSKGWMRMSGYKHATVTISQEEYRRLQETAVKKKFKEFSKLNTCDPNREQDLLNVIGQLEERERLLQNQLSSFEQPANQW